MVNWNTKCRFFNEKYACDTLTAEGYKSCEECKFAMPYSKKILIIKFEALGDVVRTTPILEALKKKYGEETMIYWLTTKSSAEILKDNPYIDKILVYNPENIMRLKQEKFDLLFSLEIDTPTTLLANIVQANEKYGFYFDNGATACFNQGAEKYLETAFLTHVKKTNRDTYQKMIFQACSLEFKGEEPIIILNDKHKKYAEDFMKSNGITETDKVLGINFSSGERWPSKAWSKENIREFIKQISNDYKVLLLGGPEEHKELPEFAQILQEQGIPVIANDPNNSIKEFTAIINLCNKVIVTDSFSLHLATAMKKPTTALFFATPEWEIEDYSIVKKLPSPLLDQFFFTNFYNEDLANSISVDEVLNTLK